MSCKRSLIKYFLHLTLGDLGEYLLMDNCTCVQGTCIKGYSKPLKLLTTRKCLCEALYFGTTCDKYLDEVVGRNTFLGYQSFVIIAYSSFLIATGFITYTTALTRRARFD